MNGVKINKPNILIGELYATYYNENLIGIGTNDISNMFYIKTWLL